MGAVAMALVGFEACKTEERLPPPQQQSTTGAGQGGGGGVLLPPDDAGPPPIDAQGFCGNQVHQLAGDSPNIYSMIDASSSMGATSGGITRFERVHEAAVTLVRDLGAFIHVGATLFPKSIDMVGCDAGEQVMPVTPGDPYSPDGDGPTTLKFEQATSAQPHGGTPTTATLEALLPGVKALSGKTLVLLMTDGAPSKCASPSCGADECPSNIQGCSGHPCCEPGGNCCAKGELNGPKQCIDRYASVDAVKAYAASDIPVYVIGVAANKAAAVVLQEMAIAAGTAQVAAPFYYAVDDLDNLSAVLGGIAAGALSCVLELTDPPDVPDQTNVYLNGALLPADLENGWRWMDPDLTCIELLGDACTALKTGKVKLVQIVSGCPTEAPK